MPPTTSAVAPGTNAINATTRGCRWEGMVSGYDGCYRSKRWISLRRSVLRMHYSYGSAVQSVTQKAEPLKLARPGLASVLRAASIIYHNYVLKREGLGSVRLLHESGAVYGGASSRTTSA